MKSNVFGLKSPYHIFLNSTFSFRDIYRMLLNSDCSHIFIYQAIFLVGEAYRMNKTDITLACIEMSVYNCFFFPVKYVFL